MRTKHANKGSRLETTVMASQRRLICMRKMPTAAIFTGGKWRPIKSPVDYVGTVRGTGRSICFDAKSCETANRFPVGNEDHFPAHQRDYLLEQGEAGAIAGLLIESIARQRFYWLDWSDLRKPDASLRWEDERMIDLGSSLILIQFQNIPGIFPPAPGASNRSWGGSYSGGSSHRGNP